MSIEVKVFKGASWLALFKFISQLFSWIITVLVARILVPDDYGLMEMATIISSYGFFFSELGVGAAIIQRPKFTAEELSSVFWFGLGLSLLLGTACFPVSYITAAVFHEPRVIPITMATSVIFVIGGLQIVPLNLLKKNMRFKEVGLIEMTGVIISSASMLMIAHLGGGVWTLLGGHIIRGSVNLVHVYIRAKWLPQLHFNYKEVYAYLRFGISVAIGQSLYFLYSRSDKIFGGRAFASTVLGYYTYALDLAQIPTEKIVVLINQVSFSAFSQLQNDKEKFNRLYLNIMKMTATIILPVFVGGFLVGGNIVKLILNEKWYPIIPLFEYLCLAQIMTALNAVNNFVHIAQGRPSWPLYFNGIMALFLPLSFYIAVQYGLNAIIIPWFTTYLIISIAWIIFTLKSIGINVKSYIINIGVSIIGTFAMVIAVFASKYVINISLVDIHIYQMLLVNMVAAISVYVSFIWYFDRRIFDSMKLLIRK